MEQDHKPISDEPNPYGGVTLPQGPTKAQTDLGDEPAADRLRRQAAEALDEGARRAQELLDQAPGGATTSEWGYRTGESLHRASSYLRSHSTNEISTDVQDWVREYPGPALACAGAIGFLLGALIQRR